MNTTIESQSFITRVLDKRWVQHMLFWSFFLLIEILQTFERADDSYFLIDFILEILRYAGIVFAVYTNLRVLIPLFLEKKRYYAYLGGLILTLLGSAIIHYLIHLLFGVEIVPKGHQFKLSLFIFFSSMHALMMIMMSSLLHFVKDWVRLKELALDMKELEKDKLEAELKALKAQINPHFLFNSLNNIYSLALDKSDKSPGLILKLSDLMSYMIYECVDEKVRIGQEVEFLKNYTDLEKVRVGDRVDVQLNFDVKEEHAALAPLLFIPFVENAFKYVAAPDDSKPYIYISVQDQENDWINIEIENSTVEELPTIKDKYHGIGIDNVRKRLNLIYPDSHELEIIHSDNRFNVKLRIKAYAN